MIGRTVSHYRIVGRLGAGGMGEVYRADDTRLKRTVALKFLPPELTRDEEAKRRFQLEAEAAASLDHPNICTIYEVGDTEDGRLFIAMACYVGQTMKARLARGPLPPAEAVWIAAQAAAGLAHAHAKGIVHRDVKPANLMLQPDGGVKVLDFGLAKRAGQPTRTKDGSTLGTVAYMSPEQASGGKVDARTDVWSLGAVLYEMVTGKVPFEGDYSQAVIYGILNHDPIAPTKMIPDLPPELERVILLCLAKEPEQRIQTMAELAVELEVAGVTGPVTLRRRTKRTGLWRRRAGTWVHRHRLVALLVLLSIAIVSWIILWQRPLKPMTPEKPLRLTLAVLPFENLAGAEKQDLADGLTEQVITRLSQMYGLSVVPRTNVSEFKETKKKTWEVAAELRVRYLLEGLVRWQAGAANAERIRVTVHLIRASDGRYLWSDQYDETAGDILGKQSLIADKVGSALRVKLVDGERPGMAAVSTRNDAAYAAWQRAEEAGTWDESLKFYKQAAALDPEFTEAHLYLSYIYMRPYASGKDRSEEWPKLAWQELERARELEPDNPWYHKTLGDWYLYIKKDYQLAEDEYGLAEHGRSGDPIILSNLHFCALRQQKYGQALRYAERGAELNPREKYLYLWLGKQYNQHQRYAEAERSLRHAMALDPEEKVLAPYLEWCFVCIRRDGDPMSAVMFLDSLPMGLRRQSMIDPNCIVIRGWAGQSIPPTILREVDKFPDIVLDQSAEVLLKEQVKGNILRQMGRKGEARAAFAEALRQLDKIAGERKGSGQEVRLLATRRDILADLGRSDEALLLARQIIRLIPRDPEYQAHFHHVLILAMVAARFGQNDLALDQLEYYFTQSLPENNVNMIKVNPFFRSLLLHRRFLTLTKKYPPDRPYTGP